MDFKSIPKIPTAEEIIEILINKGSKENDPEKKVQIVGDKAEHILEKIVKSFPDFSKWNNFYIELLKTYFPIKDIKKALYGLWWARKKIRILKKEYLKKIRRNKKFGKELRKEFYGRVFSIIRKFKNDLELLENVRRALREFPVIKDLPTVIIFGFPNVGKSSLLKALTGSEPEIREYPFTTKSLKIGYLEVNGKRIQVIDTPGVLSRKKRNQIEKRALITLKYLGNLIVYVFDPSETCGYPIKDQIKLFMETKKVEKPIIVVANKKDLWEKFEFNENYIPTSAEKGIGIKELREEILKKLKEIGAL